jgi:uncharacterized protein YlzI (FlbEa/FlbD family)
LNGKDRNMPTLSETADRAQVALQAYSTAHLNMAAAAEMVVDMVAGKAFTPAEAVEALTDFVKQYRAKLAEIDGRART